jgi:glutaredoxin 3
MAKVTVYSTTTCPYCHMEKDYLKSKGVEFEDVVLDQHPEKIEEFMAICKSRGVPCTHIVNDDGTTIDPILGFDKAKIDAALGLS